MYLNIAVRLPGLDTQLSIYRETWHQCGTCYRIMLRLNCSNTSWITKTCTNFMINFHFARRSTNANLSSQTIPTDEPDNQSLIYESRIMSSRRPAAPRTTYLNKKSTHILQSVQKDHEAKEKRNLSVNKS